MYHFISGLGTRKIVDLHFYRNVEKLKRRDRVSVVLELAGNLLAELLAEIPTALLAEIFLLLAENSRNLSLF